MYSQMLERRELFEDDKIGVSQGAEGGRQGCD